MDLVKLEKSIDKNGYKVIELKEFCKERKLKVGGTKKELVERLTSFNSNIQNESLVPKERQIHGFNYEKVFCENTGTIKSEKYGAKFDSELDNIPIQIKCIKQNNEICLGDYFRNLETNVDFLLHIAFYKEESLQSYKEEETNPEGKNKKIIEYFTFYIKWEDWKKEFENENLNLNVMKEEFKLITNLKEDDSKFDIFREKYKKYFDGKLIQLRFKRDHKTQKRVQCAIPIKNIVLLKRTFPLYEIKLKKDLIDENVSELSDNNEEELELNNDDENTELNKTELSDNIIKDSKELSKFYTNKETCEMICNNLYNWGVFNKYNFILEPSAGDGIFIKTIKNIKEKSSLSEISQFPFNQSLNILAYDIKPEGKNEVDIIKADFLTDEVYNDIIKKVGNNNLLCIGNPPFGNNNSLAIKFFNKIASIPNIFEIILILPKSFQKDSVQNRLDLNFSLHYNYDLGKDIFTLDGNKYNVPTCLQWWCRIPRIIKNLKIECHNFQYVNPFSKTKKGTETSLGEEDFDIEIVRVGGKAGFSYLNKDSPKSKYNYFIKLNVNSKIELLKEYINNKDLKEYTSKTTGPKSISKSELTPIINSFLQ